MSNVINYIVWNPGVEAFSLGPLSIRFYSLCWVLGLAAGYFVVKWLYKQQNIKPELFEPLFMYCFIGILAGARLGHCIFYQPDYFLTSFKGFVEMFLPVHFAPDSWDWKLTGYAGLASHGGTLGLMIALWLYVRWSKIKLWTVLDNIAIATPIVACAIRLGNLMNSEIIGRVTDVPWAFIFERVDMQPRHPGQLYEALAYLVIFFAGFAIYFRNKSKVGSGFFFGFCLTTIFSFRIFVEFFKEVQESFESTMVLDMGQILSIPFVVLGVYCMFFKKR